LPKQCEEVAAKIQRIHRPEDWLISLAQQSTAFYVSSTKVDDFSSIEGIS
jgi:hypothetical protein